MTKIELSRLAAALNLLRPDWPTPSLTTFLEQHFGYRPLHDATVVLAWIATDPDTKTPARALEPGPWWQAVRTADAPRVANTCMDHEHAGLRLDLVTGRTVCAGCWADRNADPDAAMPDRGGKPIPPDARHQLLTAIHPPRRSSSDDVSERPGGPERATRDAATATRSTSADAAVGTEETC